MFVAGASRAGAAFKAALFQVLFNVVTVAVGALFLSQLEDVGLLLAGADHPARALANAHLVFNLVGALAFLPWTDRLATLLDRDGRATLPPVQPLLQGA